jgi:hypothetical protein
MLSIAYAGHGIREKVNLYPLLGVYIDSAKNFMIFLGYFVKTNFALKFSLIQAHFWPLNNHSCI